LTWLRQLDLVQAQHERHIWTVLVDQYSILETDEIAESILHS